MLYLDSNGVTLKFRFKHLPPEDKQVSHQDFTEVDNVTFLAFIIILYVLYVPTASAFTSQTTIA